MLFGDRLLRDPALMQSYREWLANPITVEILNEARVAMVPLGLTAPPVAGALGERALLEYGTQIGFHRLLAYLTDLPAEAEARQKAMAASSLAADYSGVPLSKAASIKLSGGNGEPVT